MKRMLAAVFMVALMVISLSAGCGREDSPVEVARAFVHELMLGDMDAAASMLSEADADALKEFEESYGGVPPSEKEKAEAEEIYAGLRFELKEQSERTAVVNVAPELAFESLTITLVKEGGAWKVDYDDSTLLSAADENAKEHTCQANMRIVVSQSNVYAAANDGVYPTSWEDMEDYLEQKPTCPLDGSEYIVEWSSTAPPEIKCPNHGSLQK